jgi:group I intron endonuclease
MLSFIDIFPVLEVFDNLHMLENLEGAKKAFDGLSGIYGFVHTPTGTSYIGSSVDLYGRIMDHINGYSSNKHLQYAIAKYGLSSFVFVIFQYCKSSDLLKLEQYFLDILFSLPANLRYNFNPTANSRLGATHSEDTRA